MSFNGMPVPRIRMSDSIGETAGYCERPIEEVAEEIAASIPEHEWDEVPRDLARNLDSYLYGAPA